MPELPEMTVYRDHLEQHCLGRRITGAEVGREKSLNVPAAAFIAAVTGAVLAGFDRVGKHLLFHLSTGRHLVNHLMLGGAIFYGTPEEAPDRTFQVILHLEGGHSLWWTGLRLGWLHLADESQVAALKSELGLDPLDPAFTPGHLAAILKGRRGALKPLLVDQRHFPGIGNCYSDELCWAAQVHPLRKAGALSATEQERLWQAMRQTLLDAVRLGGYTETPFSAGDTFTGGYLPHLKVYDRQGQPCFRCGEPIAFQISSGRKVFCCPRCQPEQETAQPVGDPNTVAMPITLRT